MHVVQLYLSWQLQLACLMQATDCLSLASCYVILDSVHKCKVLCSKAMSATAMLMRTAASHKLLWYHAEHDMTQGNSSNAV